MTETFIPAQQPRTLCTEVQRIICSTAVLPELYGIDNSNKCEDCPDINDNPPPESDCEFFSTEHGPNPVCLKKDGTERLFSGGGMGTIIDSAEVD